jgi:hypothetical protein
VKSALLKILALLPVPATLAFVVWAGIQPAPTGALPSSAAKAGAGGSGGAGGAVDLSLPSTTKSGWKLEGTPVRYDQKSLFDRIDGAAPAYIRAGFLASVGAEFRKDGYKEPLIVDIYDMGTPPRALGIYATERDPSYRFLPVGDAAYLASGTLNFFRGRFYVKIAGYEEGEAMDRGLEALAQDLAQALPLAKDGKAALSPLAALPAEGRQPNTDGFSEPPLGEVAGLAQVFYADYKSGEAKIRIFIARCEDPQRASGRYAEAKAAFEKDKAKLEESAGAGGAKILIAQGGGASTIVASAGAVLAGAVDLQDPALVPAAKELVQKALLAGAAASTTKVSP